MLKNNNIKNRPKGKHLTSIERGKIEAYLKQNMSKAEIAMNIGVSERTIYREIKRGKILLKDSQWKSYETYDAYFAQKKYEQNQSKKEGNIKIGKDHKLASYLEDLILEQKYSPYAAIELARKLYDINFSLKTLYNYIHKGVFLKLTSKDLPHKRKVNKKYNKIKKIRKTSGKSIEERPENINNRSELGHWEIDTVIGHREKGECLLVMTERKSRYQKIIKIENKDTKSVVKAFKKLKIDYKENFNKVFKTVTSDNGSEFMDSKSIEDLGISNHYYCHSYASYERGSNENANRLIRRWIPKGLSISSVKDMEIKKLENWINNYPRKIFDGKSSNYLYKEKLGILQIY